MSRYNIEIHEFPDDYLGLVGIDAGSVVFVECNHARSYADALNLNSNVIARLEKMSTHVALPEHVLTQLKYNESELARLGRCQFLEQCVRPGGTEAASAVRLSSVFIRDEFVIAVGRAGDNNTIIFVEGIISGKLLKKALPYYMLDYAFDGEQLYGFRYEPSKAFFCFDVDLNVVWQSEICFRRSLYCQDDAPQFFQDLVIFNGSAATVQKDAFVITAFAKADGQVVWRRSFEREPYRTLLVGGKLYLGWGLALRMTVLDATTGKTLVDEPTGFKPGEGVGNPACVFPVGDHLFVFEQTNRAIRVFTQDGKTLLQEIKLPMPQSMHAFHEFQPSPRHTPLVHGDRVYCQLDHYTGLGAIGILSPPPEGEEPKITIKPRIVYDFSEIPDAQGGHGYRLHYKHDNLDDLVSAARYELMEICQYCGIDRSEHKHFDPLFNGRVTVAAERAKLPADAKDELEKMAKAVEKFLETFLVRVPFQPFKPKPGETTVKTKGRKKTPSYPRNEFKIEIELHEPVPPVHVT